MAAKRTAFGTFGGTLKNHSATDLADIAARAALQSASLKPEHVNHVIFGKLLSWSVCNSLGNVIQSSRDAAYLSRHVALRIGLPVHTPAVTINRLCGSGFEAIVNAAQVNFN